MLATLRRIVQEVNGARDLTGALTIIVSQVRQAINADVCSVYLLQRAQERFLLMATEGLNTSAVGDVSLAENEGLVGLVGTREEPINIANAAAHPRYCYLPGTDEEDYCSFLGVPIVHHRKVVGVLVVQQKAKRRFDESEVAFLVTLSAQLAGVIAHAEATGAIKGLSLGNDEPTSDTKIQGVPGATGVGIGTAVVVYPPANLSSVPDKAISDIVGEQSLFTNAINATRIEIEGISEKLAVNLPPEEHALFDVYLSMLADKGLAAEVNAYIVGGQWAQGALRQVILEHAAKFECMEDAYFRERAADVKDIGRRILSHLQENNDTGLSYVDNTILVSEELTPAMLAEVPREQLKGLVSIRGSRNSHVAILARAMGIATVMGAVDIPLAEINGLEIVVDGYHGDVYSNASLALLRHFQRLIDDEKLHEEGLAELKDVDCITLDDHQMSLWVNTGLMTDVVRSLDRGAEGVGLYRTEVPFMIKERFPSEEEQRQIYREQLQAFAPRQVTMRTLDVGGDKALSYFPIEEDNPFLGWRGIRVTLDHPEIFLVQVRAMLRASEGLDGVLRIMLPMVSNVAEIEEALHFINRAYIELVEEGCNISKPPVGVMIEVPAAVYQAKQFAQRVDFLSVGSNDLTQYLLAVDRNNPRVAELYQNLHPAVLIALNQAAQSAIAEGTPIGICGEMAGDPMAALLLMAMGYDVLSMNSTNLLAVKWLLTKVSLDWAKQLLADVLEMDNARAIETFLKDQLRQQGLEKALPPE